jgi:hypothetical protein
MSYGDGRLYISPDSSNPVDVEFMYNNDHLFAPTFEDYDPLLTGVSAFNPAAAYTPTPTGLSFSEPPVSPTPTLHEMHPYQQMDFATPQISYSAPMPVKLESKTDYFPSNHSRGSSSDSGWSSSVQSGQNSKTPSDKKDPKKEKRRQQNRRAQQKYRQRNNEYLLRIKQELEEKESKLEEKKSQLAEAQTIIEVLRNRMPQLQRETNIKQEI